MPTLRSEKIDHRGLIHEVRTVLPENGTASASGGAATLAKYAGVIITEALTTGQNLIYTLTLTNSKVEAADMVFVSIQNGTNTQGTPMLEKVTPGAGSLVIRVVNKHATAEALNGTLKIAFLVIKAS